MKVLVFGATGYVGNRLVRHLAEENHDVSGFARNLENVATLAEMGCAVVTGDMSDLTSIPSLIEGIDAVVMAAQLPLDEEYQFVSALLDAMQGTDRCFILTSGTSLMSIRTDGDWDERNYAEDERFVPRRQIAARLDTERLVRDAAGRGVRAMVVRPPLIWGHGGCQIISEFYHSARTTGQVCHIGRGLNVYSNVHVDDLATLYRLCLEKGVAGALYFAVSGEVSYGVMARAIAETLEVGTRSVTIAEGIDIWGKGLAGIVLCACSRQRSPRSREELGWAPSEDHLDILEECRNPAYAAISERPIAAWMKQGFGGRQHSDHPAGEDRGEAERSS